MHVQSDVDVDGARRDEDRHDDVSGGTALPGSDCHDHCGGARGGVKVALGAGVPAGQAPIQQLAMLRRLAELGMQLVEELAARAVSSSDHPEPKHDPGQSFARASRPARRAASLDPMRVLRQE